jgi:hypothetical protein
MKKLLVFAVALVGWNVSAQTFIIERPTFDGVVIVGGATPVESPSCTPVVYDQPVVYNAPVQYNGPVIYNGPVVYNTASATTCPTTCANDLNGLTITVYPRRNRCSSNVTIIGRGSARVR